MESSKGTVCQAQEGPILCTNNCGFFESAAMMNICSKCPKSMISEQQQSKLAAFSIESIVNGSSSSIEIEPVFVDMVDVQARAVELKTASNPASSNLASDRFSDVKAKEGSNRCTTYHKRLGVMVFNCSCGNPFCSVHCYSDKHDCQYDYRTAARDAIDKANLVVKAEKFEKI
ncbi:unnamed protein product [Fraxinus pennsylvanica]|uniref:Zinc finger A20 and AN1 domain-containing stress-associated protein 8 n=1 Tax=Fraxinus pennsylvanica TaxID=56036 RepID=A0AAD2A7A7_9LAMI|nr:unnamed protein product [Fraxinus pennsylvanica]